MPTAWTAATQSATAFTEASGSADSWTEGTQTGTPWMSASPAPGYGVQFVLLDLPIQQIVNPGGAPISWTEATL